MNTQPNSPMPQGDDDVQAPQQGTEAEADALLAELDALSDEMNEDLHLREKHAALTEKRIESDAAALAKDVEHMDKELTAAEKDAQKHMDIVDEV
jgi:vancomycin resistance protein YoaR